MANEEEERSLLKVGLKMQEQMLHARAAHPPKPPAKTVPTTAPTALPEGLESNLGDPPNTTFGIVEDGKLYVCKAPVGALNDPRTINIISKPIAFHSGPQANTTEPTPLGRYLKNYAKFLFQDNALGAMKRGWEAGNAFANGPIARIVKNLAIATGIACFVYGPLRHAQLSFENFLFEGERLHGPITAALAGVKKLLSPEVPIIAALGIGITSDLVLRRISGKKHVSWPIGIVTAAMGLALGAASAVVQPIMDLRSGERRKATLRKKVGNPPKL